MLADQKQLQQQICQFEALIAAEQYDEACNVCVEIELHLARFQYKGNTVDVSDDIRALKSLFDIKIEELKKKLHQIQITIASFDQFRFNKVSETYQKNNY